MVRKKASSSKNTVNTPPGGEIVSAVVDDASDAPEDEVVEPAAAPHAQTDFPIVGIGASAGGLEALELFMGHVPSDSGMAFVIVQHLDPTHKGVMAELLQRGTSMNVVQVTDGMHVQPNSVYVIPPNKDMSILHGVLHLLDPVAPRGLRLPIDYFLRSLADDQQERCIGVILSGMGSDGTLGLRAIKEKAGLVLVQDPASAKFDGMPRSAIDAGLADVVAPAEELPAKIRDYLRHVPLAPKPRLATEDTGNSGIEKVVILLRARMGHDFSLYKRNTLYRRVERRMGLHKIEKMASYIRYLQENPNEIELLFKELLIGVTSFFRDRPAWDILASDVIPSLLKERMVSQPFRAWIPACSTGEEAYSLAVLLREAAEKEPFFQSFSAQIFGTDLDSDAIDKARAGIFPANVVADISAERLGRFFVETENGSYSVSKAIREMAIFAVQNVIMDPPFTKLDCISCRNLLIYLTPELQRKLIPLFHYSLKPGGILFLGGSETISGFEEFFAPIDSKARIYRRLDTVPRAEPMAFSIDARSSQMDSLPEQTTLQPSGSLQSQAEQLILQTFSPSAVLVNNQGDILYISGRTGKYLEPAAGKANWNVFAMARDGIRSGLTSAFRKALAETEPQTVTNLRVADTGAACWVDVTVQPIVEPEGLRGLVMIVFADVAAPAATKGRRKAPGKSVSQSQLADMERELELARQEARTIREEMQTSQEELKSSNEELQSTNEELQSTNEELTTSKEEMQSMNEELQTLNHELQAKLDDLSRLNSDMNNLLESTEITTLFLDDSLSVRLFTTGARKIFKLIPADVGRPITDIVSELVYPELANHAREVLRTLIFHEEQVKAVDGRWFRVRIMPYRSQENIIDGVVITFADISAAVALEEQLRRTQAGLELEIEARDVQLRSGQATKNIKGDNPQRPKGTHSRKKHP